MLTNLDGLSALTSVGENLTITGNDVLTNLDGFSSLSSVGGRLTIAVNIALSNLCGIKTLLDVSFSGTYAVFGNAINPTQTDDYFNTCTLSVNAFFDKTFSLYPNPTTGGILKLQDSENREYEITVLDCLGNVLIRSIISNEKSVDISNLVTGVYFVRISYENQSTVKKIVL